MKQFNSTFKRSFALINFLIVANVFYGQISNAKSAVPLVRLEMTRANFNDETVFYFQQGGSTSFQPAYDAYKLIANPNVPYIGSMSDSILTSISGLPELTVNISVPVKAISPVTNTFTFSTLQTDFPDNVCVTLYDRLTGTSTNILSNNYVCTLYDTTNTPRFTMNFFTTPLNATSIVKQGSCQSRGRITAQGSNAGPWNYEWSIGDSIVKTSLNKYTADTLDQLGAGNYSLKINTVGQCDNFSKNFTVDAVEMAKASFTADRIVTNLSNSGEVQFTSTSKNALFNIWNFGDNSGTYYMPAPTYNYHSAGVYTVTLIAESASHCKDTATHVVEVIDDVTGISELSRGESCKLASLSQGEYALLTAFDKACDVELTLLDLNGNLLRSTTLQQITSTKEPVSLQGFAEGMYLLRVQSGNSEKIYKLLR